jgi:hypothetical protein
VEPSVSRRHGRVTLEQLCPHDSVLGSYIPSSLGHIKCLNSLRSVDYHPLPRLFEAPERHTCEKTAILGRMERAGYDGDLPLILRLVQDFRHRRMFLGRQYKTNCFASSTQTCTHTKINHTLHQTHNHTLRPAQHSVAVSSSIFLSSNPSY